MDFSNYKLPSRQKAPPTYLHEIVRQVCEYLYGCDANDPMCWRMWLGIGSRISAGQLKAKLDYIKERGIKNNHYLLKICK